MMSDRKRPDLLPVIALVILLGQLFLTLSPSWSRSDYYDFGWLALPFCLVLSYRRWSEQKKSPAQISRFVWLVFLGALVLLIPLRISEIMDPLWRLPLWIHVIVVLFIVHVLLAWRGGWKASISCLPATLLCLTAVPLPSVIENPLIAALTNGVVELAHSALLLSGHAVERMGQLLLTKAVPLDIADGCSGIRSFQSSAAAALFLGEWCRGSLKQRGILVILSLCLAVGGNALRIFLLARIAETGDEAAVASAHDPLGLIVLCLVYGGVSLAAWLIHRKRVTSSKRQMKGGLA